MIKKLCRKKIPITFSQRCTCVYQTRRHVAHLEMGTWAAWDWIIKTFNMSMSKTDWYEIEILNLNKISTRKGLICVVIMIVLFIFSKGDLDPNNMKDVTGLHDYFSSYQKSILAILMWFPTTRACFMKANFILVYSLQWGKHLVACVYERFREKALTP